jgi:cardiolipin synthase
MVIDRDWSTVGSSNLDERSLRLNFELSLLVHNPDLNRDLARIFEDVLEKAVEINREEFARRPLTQRLMESALRPFSPLL